MSYMITLLYPFVVVLEIVIMFVIMYAMIYFMRIITGNEFNSYNSILHWITNKTVITAFLIVSYILMLGSIYEFQNISTKLHMHNTSVIELPAFIVIFLLFVIVEVGLGIRFYHSFKQSNPQLNNLMLHRNTLSFISSIILEHIEILAFILTAISFPNTNDFTLSIIAVVMPLTFFMFRIKEKTHYLLLLKDDKYV